MTISTQPAAGIATVPPVVPVNGTAPEVTCPTCGGESAADARFCRHCGARLANAAPDAVVASAAGAAAAASVSEEIDIRRARQLVERAAQMLERNDVTSAVLACRQAVALAPTMAGVHSMLGLLLERAGEPLSAAQAYERALQLDPGNSVDRDALDRLRAAGELSHGQFQFNEEELFDVAADTVGAQSLENAGLPHPPSVPEAPTAAAATANSVAEPGRRSRPGSTGGAGSGASPRAVDRRSVAVPVAIDRRRVRDRRAPLSAVVAPPAAASGIELSGAGASVAGVAAGAAVAAAAATAAASAAASRPTPALGRPIKPAVSPPLARPVPTVAPPPSTVLPRVPPPEPRPSTMQLLAGQPAWLRRGVPIAAAALLGLGLIVWAHSRSGANASTPSEVGGADVGQPALVRPAPVSAASRPGSAVPAPPAAGPALITNAVPTPVPAGAPAVRTVSSPSGSRRPASARTSLSSPGAPSLAPAGIAPSTPSVTASALPPVAAPAAPNGGVGALPPADIGQSQPASPPIKVLPFEGGGSGEGNSSGGAPLNPAGAPGQPYIRVTQGRVGVDAAPDRPANRSRAAEARAAAAAAGGHADQAIRGLTQDLDSGSTDRGLRYQDRATLFLQKGDYRRAADDFQSAISAYGDQIARGDDVKTARDGMQSSRTGLSLALAGERNGG